MCIKLHLQFIIHEECQLHCKRRKRQFMKREKRKQKPQLRECWYNFKLSTLTSSSSGKVQISDGVKGWRSLKARLRCASPWCTNKSERGTGKGREGQREREIGWEGEGEEGRGL